MVDNLQSGILHTLDARRDELLYYVTESLIQRIPMIGIPAGVDDSAARHQHNMELTAQRFHQIVQAGAGIDWSLVQLEYDWAGRKLSSLGATWEHQQVLIDVYFGEALWLPGWSETERAALQQMADHMREVAEAAYSKPAS
jgi:hypothetical protein